MMKRITLISAILTAMLFSGCATRTLETGGAYNSDQALWAYDGTVLEFAEVTQKFLEVAERNEAAVQQIDGLPEFVEKLQETRKDIIEKALGAREVYLVTMSDDMADEMTRIEKLLMVAVRQAQLYLTKIALEGSEE